jgi:hypothetical protein
LILTLYAAERPWCSWRLFASEEFSEGWYNPAIPAKFISADGSRFLMFVVSCSGLPQRYNLNVLEVQLVLKE